MFKTMKICLTVAVCTLCLATVGCTKKKSGKTTAGNTTIGSTTNKTTLGTTTIGGTTTVDPNANFRDNVKTVFVSSNYSSSDNGSVNPDDGRMGFSTIESALKYYKNGIADNTISAEEEKRIFICYGAYAKKGIYDEKLTIDIPNLTMYASDNIVTIQHDDYAGTINPDTNSAYGSEGSATVTITSSAVNFKAYNITFKNSWDYLSNMNSISQAQALAILVKADSATFSNCKFYGYQDTLQAKEGRSFYYNCDIYGAVDFIYGVSATAYFENCKITSLNRNKTNNGYISAPKGGNGLLGADRLINDYGFIFKNCSLLFDPNYDVNDFKASVGLARPWGADAYVAFIDCYMDAHISPAFVDWDTDKTAENARFYEIGSYGPGAVATRGAAKTYTAEELAKVKDKAVVFGLNNGDYTYQTEYTPELILSELAMLDYDMINFNDKTTTYRVNEDRSTLGLLLPFDWSMVVDNIDLPSRGANGTLITWESDKPSVINTQGIVNRPAIDGADETVKLKATVSYRGYYETAEFTAVVPKQEKVIIITLTEEKFDYDVNTYLEKYWTASGSGTAQIVDTVPYNNHPNDVANVLKVIQTNAGASSFDRKIGAEGEMAVEFYALQSQNGINGAVSLVTTAKNQICGFDFNKVDETGNRNISAINGETITPTDVNMLEGVWYKFRFVFNNDLGTYNYGYYDYATGELVSLGSGIYDTVSPIAYVRVSTEIGKTPENSALYIADIKGEKTSEFVEASGTNPNKTVGIGVTTGTADRVIHDLNSPYSEPTITVYDRFTLGLLTEGEDYTVEFTGIEEIDITTVGKYNIGIIITLTDGEQVTYQQVVDVQDPTNKIILTDFTQSVILSEQATFTATASRDDGMVYFYIVLKDDTINKSEPTAEHLKAQKNTYRAAGAPITQNVTVASKGTFDLTTKGMYFSYTASLDSTKEYYMYLVTENSNGFSEVYKSEIINDKVYVKTVDDFAAMICDPGNAKAKFYIMNDIDFTDVILGAGIVEFQGLLDGNGYTLTNLTFNNKGGVAHGNAGIFAILAGGTVRNINFKNVTFNSEGTYSALIAGRSTGAASITNVHVDGFVFKTPAQYNAGLVARVDAGSLTISKCSIVNANFTFTSKYSGGIVACAYKGSVSMTDVMFKGIISCPECVGGLLGRTTSDSVANKAVFERCIVSVVINGANKQAAGIIGFNESDGTTIKANAVVIFNVDSSATSKPSSTNLAQFGNVVGSGKTEALVSGITNTYVINSANAPFATCEKGIEFELTSKETFALTAKWEELGYNLTDVWEFSGSNSDYVSLRK